MKRAMCLYIPYLSTDRKCSQERAEQDERSRSAESCAIPRAVISSTGRTVRIVQPDALARRAGVRAGQTLAEAKAVAPTLLVREEDPAADRRQLEALAVWAECLSPVVHIEGDDSLLLDVTGCAVHFGGEENLAARARKNVTAQGFRVRAALADTPGAAWALAHAHADAAVIVPPGQTTAALAPLPVWSLRLSAETTASLAALGVDTVATLLYLPRASLTSRFGEEVLRRVDQALGNRREFLTAYRPEPIVYSGLRLEGATDRVEMIRAVLRRVLALFCAQLDARRAGVRQVFLTLRCQDVYSTEGRRAQRVNVPLLLAQPTRASARLERLFVTLLEAVHLPTPVESLTVWSREVEPLDDRQGELFDTAQVDEAALSDLLERLVARLGAEAVLRPRLQSEHAPERAVRLVSVVEKPERRAPAAAAGEPVGGLRPLRLLARPIEVAAMSVVPDGPPVSFRLSGEQHPIAHSVGPERIETGWWRGAHVRRDYHRVVTATGRGCWLFRDRESGRWYLHGWFD